ncbi:MAG TPA: hypothetical protein ENN74_01050 [Firmicutes bacterium]|nr:hypothetical protein [Bacillota bacterium]
MVLSLAFSAAVLFFQRNAFADFTEVGGWIAGGNFRGGKIFATEVYNPGNYNLKLSFWAGQPVAFLESLDSPALQPGDFLVLSNVYNAPLERVYAALSSRCDFEVVSQTQRYRLIPLLPDIMVYPPGATSQPLCMAYRYHPQEYYSYVIRITGVRG